MSSQPREIATIGHNSIGAAVAQPLGVAAKRAPDARAHARSEPALYEKLFEARRRLVEADLGEGVATPTWGAQRAGSPAGMKNPAGCGLRDASERDDGRGANAPQAVMRSSAGDGSRST